jgi:aryl-alcohol dehydrogenase-like predicted oxidoreductase
MACLRSETNVAHGPVSVQNQFSPAFRSSGPELQLCDQLGITFLPWSPLGGIKNASGLGASYQPVAEVAQEVDASPQQVTLAWMLAKSPVMIPIPGSSRPETITASAAAADLALTPEQVARLDQTSNPPAS